MDIYTRTWWRACHLSQPTISHHLKVLYDNGLLDRDKHGAWVYYRARMGALASLTALIGNQGVTTRRRRAAGPGGLLPGDRARQAVPDQPGPAAVRKGGASGHGWCRDRLLGRGSDAYRIEWLAGSLDAAADRPDRDGGQANQPEAHDQQVAGGGP
jgi:DNA-binding transcriptional ArsR family regulator